MIRYRCPQCRARLESPASLAGEEDKCPACGQSCRVPVPKKRGRWPLLVLGGVLGVAFFAGLGFVIEAALSSRSRWSPSSTATVRLPAAVPAGQASDTRREDRPGRQTQPASPQSRPAKPPARGVLSPEQLFELASPAVVYIVVRDREFKSIGLGSGFFVDPNGLIVTNLHVIRGAEFATARLSTGGTLFVDGVTATDANSDLALLKVSGGGFPCLKNADAPLPKVGSAVYAIGNPRGLENTFSGGMVSGHREIKEGLTAIQVTTPISPGSSGGPLLNAKGEVVGVTTAYLMGGQNLNFALPVAAVRALIQRQGKVRALASAGGLRLGREATEKLDAAWEAMSRKDYSAATKLLTELRQAEMENPSVWFALGFLHGQLRNHDIAIACYKKAIELKPDWADAYYNIAVACLNLGRYTEAIVACKQAIALKPDYAAAYYNMGAVHHRLGHKAAAIAAYNQFIALEPTGPAAEATRQKILMLTGQ